MLRLQAGSPSLSFRLGRCDGSAGEGGRGVLGVQLLGGKNGWWLGRPPRVGELGVAGVRGQAGPTRRVGGPLLGQRLDWSWWPERGLLALSPSYQLGGSVVDVPHWLLQ